MTKRPVVAAIAGILLATLLLLPPPLGGIEGDVQFKPFFAGPISAPATSNPIDISAAKYGAAARIWGDGATATGEFFIDIRTRAGRPWKTVGSYTVLAFDDLVPDGGEGGEYLTLPTCVEVRFRVKTLSTGKVDGEVEIHR